MIFVTLMLPVEVRILPTYKVVADLGMLDTYAGLTMPLIASATATFLFRQFFLTIPDELAEAARIDGAGPLRFFWDVVRAAVDDQHRRAVRHPVHLRLEPVSVAAAGHHRRVDVHDGDRHQAHDRRRRRGDRMEPGHGHRDARDAAAGAGRDPDAEVVRQGPGGHGEIAMASVDRSATFARATASLEVIHGVDAEVADGEFIVHRRAVGLRQVDAAADGGGARDDHRAARSRSATAWSTTLEPKDRDIAMVFQNYALYPHMSVYDNMAYGLQDPRLAKADIDSA